MASKSLPSPIYIHTTIRQELVFQASFFSLKARNQLTLRKIGHEKFAEKLPEIGGCLIRSRPGACGLCQLDDLSWLGLDPPMPPRWGYWYVGRAVTRGSLRSRPGYDMPPVPG